MISTFNNIMTEPTKRVQRIKAWFGIAQGNQIKCYHSTSAFFSLKKSQVSELTKELFLATFHTGLSIGPKGISGR